MTYRTLIPLLLVLTFDLHAAPPRAIRVGESNLLEEDAPRLLADLTFAPLITSANDTSATPGAPGVNESLGLGVDARATLGYAFDGTWIAGVTYNHYQLKTTRDFRPYGVDGVSQTATHDEWGPTVGATMNGWRMLVTYFISGNQRVATRARSYLGTSGDVTVKNRKLDGFQIALSYTFRLTPRFEVGPSLVYRKVAYHSQAKRNAFYAPETYDYVNLFSAQRASAVTPMLTALLRF